jgi:hypothetical protein
VPADPLSAQVIRDAPDERAFGHVIGVVRAEDLIVMKLLARRVQDVVDVQGLLVANRGTLDLDRIRRWLPELDDMKPGASALFDELRREFLDLPPPPPPA